MSVLQFKADLRAFAAKIDVELGLVMQKITLDMFSDIVGRTPVDTGRARAGWAVGIGSYGDFMPPPAKKGEKGVQFQAPAAPDVSAVDGTQAVFIYNNVEYIQALEDGHSKQAPAGMVKLALTTAELKIEQLLAA